MTLVLVADPKQAIYAFRGADVYAYLMAAATAATQATLRVNRRSDQPLLDAFDALFADARLGHEEIVYRQVRATPRSPDQPRLRGAPERRRAPHPGRPPRRAGDRADQPRVCQGGLGPRARRPRPRRRRRPRCCLRTRRSSTAPPTASRPAQEPVCPRHIAVLVRTHANAELVCAQLERGARAGGHQRRRQRVRDRDGPRLAAAARGARAAGLDRSEPGPPRLTPFLGWSGERIATAPEPEWEEVHRRLHRWSRILRDSGVAALTEAIMVGEDLAARMLAEAGGERRLTDLRHVAQLLHRAASRRATRRDRAARLARRAHRRRGARGPAGGRADAAARVRRRGGAGADHPPQQGARVPGRLLPVPVGAELRSRAIRSRCPSTTPPPGSGTRSTSGSRAGPGTPTCGATAIEQRGEDLQARLRRADSRQAPGRDLVGRLLRQPQLAARAAAVRQGRRTANVAPEGRSTPTDAAAVERFRELAAARAGARSASSARRSRACRPRGVRRSSRRSSWRRRGSTAASTCGGGGPPTPTSPPRRTIRWWRASPSGRS